MCDHRNTMICAGVESCKSCPAQRMSFDSAWQFPPEPGVRLDAAGEWHTPKPSEDDAC